MFAQDDNQSAHKTLNLSIILISKHQRKANNANSFSKLKVLEYSADDEFIYTIAELRIQLYALREGKDFFMSRYFMGQLTSYE